jgi:hypothetical protein
MMCGCYASNSTSFWFPNYTLWDTQQRVKKPNKIIIEEMISQKLEEINSFHFSLSINNSADISFHY